MSNENNGLMEPQKPQLVGLTGGIGSGKSLVSRMLADLGCAIIDADKLARQVVEPGTPGLQELVEAFGTGILTPDQGLDRKSLRTIVFDNPNALATLNAILHPRIKAAMWQQAMALQGKQCRIVYDAALLMEGGSAGEMAAVVLVVAPEEERCRRVAARDGVTEASVLAIIRNQMPDDKKRAIADIVIDNGGSIEATYRQVAELWEAWPVPL